MFASIRCWVRGLIFTATLAFFAFNIPLAADASTITVNTLNDGSASGDGECSLREAVTNAISESDESGGDCVSGTGNDTIVFAVSGTIGQGCGGYQFGINNVAPPSVTIDGSGQNVVLDGHLCSVFQLGAGATLNLRALTLTDSSGNVGGAIGVFGSAALTVTESTFVSNIVGQHGAAIYNNGGTVVVTNSTFSNNQANGGGSAIFNDGAGTVSVSNSTFAGNHNGGIVNASGSFALANSVLSGNAGANCGGTIGNGGYNISDDASCGFGTSIAANGDAIGDSVTGASIALDPLGLQNNGGPTQTIALESGSFAIDAIPLAFCPATDQRSLGRPDNGETACDIGAFEFGATPPGAPPTITISAPTNTTYTLNQAVPSVYSCTDPVAGDAVTVCAGPVADGVDIDTASVGSKTFTVNATDSHNNSSSATVNYTVAYNICPLYSQSTSVKSGATIPIKLDLCDINGVDQSASSIVVHATGVVMVSNNASEVLQDAGNSNPDDDFRFDSTLGTTGGYIFNLSTKGYPTGTFQLQFTAGNDPTTHVASFQVH